MLVVISSMLLSLSNCNHFHVRRANNGGITPFLTVCLFFAFSFVGTPFTQWHEILLRNTRDTELSYGLNRKSLSHLVLERYRVVTDGQTELP